MHHQVNLLLLIVFKYFPLAKTLALVLDLAREHPIKNGSQAVPRGLNILESFYYVRNNRYFPKLYPYFENFMLDSGAFTFMQDSKITLDWMKYTEDYADFINKYDVQLFFELDINVIN